MGEEMFEHFRLEVDAGQAPMRIDKYMSTHLEDTSRSHIQQALKEGYVQIGDVPGRNEPTTGEINYKNVFKHIWDKGYRGILGMEHGQSDRSLEGDKKLLRAYREVDVA